MKNEREFIELRNIIIEKSYKENQENPFTLASGKLSPYYFDLKQTLMQPHALSLACKILYDEILDRNPNTVALAGLTMGADPIIYALSLYV